MQIKLKIGPALDEHWIRPAHNYFALNSPATRSCVCIGGNNLRKPRATNAIKWTKSAKIRHEVWGAGTESVLGINVMNGRRRAKAN